MPARISAKSRKPLAPKRRPRAMLASAERSPDPLYSQVADALRKEIVDGTYQMGGRLPTEDELRERFGVSRHTVREALRQLREDGLVSSRQGSGTEVVWGPATASYALDVMSVSEMSIHELVSWSAGKRFQIESVQTVTLDAELAARSGLPSGEDCLVVRGTGHEDDSNIPASWAEYYIKREYAGVARLLPRHKGPIFPLIEDLFGVRVVEVNQEIGATLVPIQLARVLKVKPRSAALEVRRTFRLASGQIAQVTVTTHPASRHRHSVTLRRVKS